MASRESSRAAIPARRFWDDQKRVVGLLYAGSNTTTLMNPIQDVLIALNVEIVT
jgi:hypothetical protein